MTGKDELVLRGITAGDRAFTGPYGLQVGVTDHCNYGCVFCATFSHKNPDRSADENSTRLDTGRFAALVREAAELEVEQISLVGVGEPFLHPDIMLFIKEIKARSIRCMVTTNGSALTRRRIDEIVESEMDILNISLNAATEDTYALIHGEKHRRLYGAVLEHLSRLARIKRERGKNKPRLALRFVMTNQNIGELRGFVDLAIRLGADELFFQNYVPPAFGRDIALDRGGKEAVARILLSLKEKMAEHGLSSNIDAVVSRYGAGAGLEPEVYQGYRVDDTFYYDNPCYVGWTYAMILANGAVMPCCYCGVAMGNINDDSFKNIWFGDRYNRFRKVAADLPVSRLGVEGCKCFNNCGSTPDNIKIMKRFGLDENKAQTL